MKEVKRYISKGCFNALIQGKSGNTWGLATSRTEGMDIEVKIIVPEEKMNKENERYQLKTGKYGPYFFDCKYKESMSLDDVLIRLNDEKMCKKLIGRQVMVFNRYLFAVPVKGTITSISSHDGFYQITFQQGQHGGTNVNKHDGGYFFPQECQLIDEFDSAYDLKFESWIQSMSI